jgi:plastocyanin
MPFAGLLVAWFVVAAAPAAPALEARDFRFEPENATVAAGSEVLWRNAGSQPHSVTALDGAFSSEAPPGREARFVAPIGPGLYPFVCAYHFEMKGNLTVEAATVGPSAPPSPTPAASALAVLSLVGVAVALRPRPPERF